MFQLLFYPRLPLLPAMAADSVPLTKFVSHPIANPRDVYPDLPAELKDVNFGLSKPLLCGTGHVEDRQETLRKFHDYLLKQQSNSMGYQANQHIENAEELLKFVQIHTNNIGDPFMEGGFTTNTKCMERAVLDYYASLWNAKWPHIPQEHASELDPDGESYWGFLLTMGSTEGNMYALWNARDYLSGKVLLLEQNNVGLPCLVYRQAHVPDGAAPCSRSGRTPAVDLKDFTENYFSPVSFYSEDTHYSFAKAVRLIGVPLFSMLGNEKYKDQCPLSSDGKWPEEVPSYDDGSINIEKLAILVEFFAARGHPIFISLNYGSTFKGAYDDVEKIIESLTPIFEAYGLLERHIEEDNSKRTGYWIHVDGALGSTYMPYLKIAKKRGLTFGDGTPLEVGPNFDFSLGIHSIAVSGHKWMGATGPCGAYMSKRRYQVQPPSTPVYIGTPDTTFAGSRNGFSVLFFWADLSLKTLDQQIEKTVKCFETVRYIEKSLKALGEELKLDLWVARSPAALTVHFRQLNTDLVKKYSISNETLLVDGEVRAYSHVFAMEHVTETLVDSLVSDIRALGEGAFAPQPSTTRASSLPKPLEADPLVSFVPFQGRGFSSN